MLDKGKPAFWWRIFMEEGYGIFRGGGLNALERLNVGRFKGLGEKQIPRCARDDKRAMRRVGTMYRAPTRAKRKHHPDRGGEKPTWAESTGLRKERWRPKGTPLQVRRAGTIYRAPTGTNSRSGRSGAAPLQKGGQRGGPGANADLAASDAGSVELIL